MHVTQLTVRDYECDQGGVVNNAVYQNYLEHARHEFLKNAFKLSFSELAKSNMMFVIIEANLKYRKALRSGDSILIETSVEKASRNRKFNFEQTIRLYGSDTLILNASFVGAAIKDDLPLTYEEIFGINE